MPDGPAALLHFILLSDLWIWVMGTLGGRPAVGGTSGSSLLGHTNSALSKQPSIVLNPMPSSCLHQWAQAHQHHCIHSSHQQCPGFCSPSVWLYGKHYHYLGILWRILLSLPQTLPARRHICHMLGINVGSCFPLGLRCHASTLQGTVDLDLRWHHPARGPSALTKLTQHNLQFQHLHQKRWQL